MNTSNSQTNRTARASELERQAKALRREEQAFWDEVYNRKGEVLERLQARLDQPKNQALD